MTTQVAETFDESLQAVVVRCGREGSPFNNYVRAGGVLYFFDDTDELGCRRLFKQLFKQGLTGAQVTLYRMLPWGWLTYVGGTRVILPCPEDRHEWIRTGEQVHCVHCSLSDRDTEVE